jgi:hypothetical protein
MQAIARAWSTFGAALLEEALLVAWAYGEVMTAKFNKF